MEDSGLYLSVKQIVLRETKEKESRSSYSGRIDMSVLQAILLGIVQGITEFLPVSSFGHLTILEGILGVERGPGVLFEVMLHVGTLAALIIVFFKDVRQIGIEFIGIAADLIGNANLYLHNKRTGENLHYARIVHNTYRKFTVLILISLIPTVILGYTARRLVTMWAGSALMPGIGLLMTGIVLLVVDFSKLKGERTPRTTNYGHAMWMGICQGISVFPGLSRSGLTISAGLFCGLSRKFAVKYSYIMSIPAVAGAMILELGEFAAPEITLGLGFTYVLGMIVAGAVGVFTVQALISWTQKIKFRYFAIYCFTAGIVGLAVNFIS